MPTDDEHDPFTSLVEVFVPHRVPDDVGFTMGWLRDGNEGDPFTPGGYNAFRLGALREVIKEATDDGDLPLH